MVCGFSVAERPGFSVFRYKVKKNGKVKTMCMSQKDGGTQIASGCGWYAGRGERDELACRRRRPGGGGQGKPR